MTNPWVVEPEEVKLELNWTDLEGTDRPFWIKAKKRLSIGEQRRMLKSISKVTTPIASTKTSERATPEASFEWTEYSFSRCLAYLIDWSLMNGNDKRMPVSRETLESLHQSLFDIIDNALDEHEKEVTLEKKVKPSSRKRKRTSA
jgi:hypothetical protein